MNGLFRAGATEDDKVVLLCRDTIDGVACGKALVTRIEDAFGARASVERVPGLRVDDPIGFRRRGVPALFEILDKLVRNVPQEETARINVSGGFKGVVPFVMLYAMFKDLRVSYVFERTDSEIMLPSIPIEFDWRRYWPAAEALMRVSEATALSKNKIEDVLPKDNYEFRLRAFDSLFESYEDEIYGPSALGLLVLGRLHDRMDRAEVRLGRSARAALSDLSGGRDERIHSILSNIRNPLVRDIPLHRHRLHNNSDLLVWKAYARGGPRLLYKALDNVIYIAEIFQNHDEYDRFLKNERRNFDDYDVRKFEPYRETLEKNTESSFLEEQKIFETEENEEILGLRIENDKLREQVNLADKKISEARHQHRLAESNVNRAKEEKDSALRDKQQLERRSRELERRNGELEQRLLESTAAAIENPQET